MVAQVVGGWALGATSDQVLTAGQVAHSFAGYVFTDDDLDPAGQVRLAFGLLDLIDGYWVTCVIRMAHLGPDGPLPADALWDAYRRRLEADRDAEPVAYSLWVDWSEDHATAETAFAEAHVAELRLVLAAGHANHRCAPGAWDEAVRACS